MDFVGEGEDDCFEDISDDLLSSIDTPTEELTNDALDFKDRIVFQKEIVFNKLLPYADILDSEADALLAKIKANLGRCIMLRDIKPGCAVWSNMLQKYITLYDLRFSKEDHITFIKLMYELLTIPNLEPSLISAFGYRLYMLLRKSDLISPKELELPWRPLFDLCNRIMPKKPHSVTCENYPTQLKNLLDSIVCFSKIYFPVNATQEILDELRPQVCPFNGYLMQITMKSFQLFLPVQLAPEHHSLSHELWFHEFMKLWDICSASSYTWGNSVMHLMSKLAYFNIGYIDWEPYIPLMFTRFVQSFNLPVTYKKIRCNSTCRMTPYYIAVWITSVLGPKSNAQTYLDKFLKTVETYFHPANYGSWLKKLGELFVNISYFVVLRINRERYQNNSNKPNWKIPIPDSHKLTDAEIDAFVESMMPIAMLGIFNKRYTQLFYDALKYLADMRPNLVIPSILEKIYPTLGSDIEPHKMITAMTCMITISRPLVQGSRICNKEYAFQQGPFHVLSLLFTSLSGIDPNDANKCFITFRLIATYVTMIPLVDCSQSTAEMSEDDRLVCEETSRFEDFVLQFMDKVFVWIDSSAVVSVRLENNTNGNGKSRSEAMAESALNRVFATVLRQCSHPIFMSALGKLRSFIIEHVLETQVAGQLVGVLCKVFTSVNSEETLKALVPFLSEKILDAIGEGDEILKADNLDNQLLYPLLLLNRLVLTQGKYLLPYMDTLLKVIDKTIMLKSREGNMLGCFTLSNVFQSFSTVTFINVERNLNNPQYPYVQDWGETIKIKGTKIQSYTPGEKEEEVLQEIFIRYFMPTVTKIQNFIKSQNSLSRDDLQITLRILFNILDGCDAALPFWSEPALKIEPYENCVERLEPFLGFSGKVHMPDGGNVRYFLVQLMAELQEIMLKNVEDDTKSLTILQLIWQYLLLGKLRLAMDSCFKFSTNYCISKKVVENKMTGSLGWFPNLVLVRVNSQHQMRKLCTTPVLTETHISILLHLLKLSTSQYSRIRMRAQESLVMALGYFPNAYIALKPHIIEILERDPTDHHDAYKGILYLITRKINQQESLLTRQDWGFLKSLWSALVLSGPSEKPSVIRLKDIITNETIDNFHTTNIKTEIPDSVVTLAAKLWENESMKPNEPLPTENEITQGVEKLREKGEINLKVYNELLDILLHALLEKNLHWRHRQIAMTFIYVMLNEEVKFSAKIVRFFLNSLINESIDERRMALRVMLFVFKQQKKKHIKKKIDIPFNNNNTITEYGSNSLMKVQPGYRTDNAWLQYNYDNRPTNSTEWDEPRYMHKSNIGYYAWPRELEVYAASCEQPGYEKSSLSEQDKEIEQFFGDQQNVDRLIEYLSLEGKKGRDKFSNGRLLVFKGLFRNHGDSFLGNFLPHLRKLVADKQESSQRCAAEIICGLIRGSKHWPFDMTERLWHELLPIIRSALSNLTVETINDWTLCIANASKDRDPNKLHWLLECIMEESPLGQSEASFVESGRLMILQGVLSTQIWRVGELMNRLLLRFENRLQESPFQNVRDRMASTLMSIFRANVKFDPTVSNGNPFPEVNDFLEKVYPRLQSLLDEDESSSLLADGVATINTESAKLESSQSRSSPNGIDPTRERNIRLFKTVCRWILETVLVSNLDNLSSFYKIYPIMCQFENNEKDEELSKTCSGTVAVLAQTLTQPRHVPAVLDAVTGISKSTSWSARANCLEFLQVLVFHNMSILLSNGAWISAIQDIVLNLLQDERLEVREKAAKVLGGLLHCTILPNQEGLLDEFKKKARTKLGNKRKRLLEEKEEIAITAKIVNAARLRHAGVLGMCAFIQAHPYNVPKIVPPIFECLSSHLNDPEPIPSTIRKTLNDFKRTHCDGWTGLQGLAEKFTEEQFALLQDLTVPPSYYA
ncbi:proteasome activator complex subunit 4 [Nasonia vitripennis]|uniref:Proteasome activator complex subunit 4 n=1 Tax=Nasonia vitripennis TaxID=7425 RepID=A0A7M7QRA0_NASVI|nr:proteasome activator complex subunit 4 [Nasonia vitripennis]XP_032452856.1 proteasome activator complex subunit 4 [Nasonia vitripennis]